MGTLIVCEGLEFWVGWEDVLAGSKAAAEGRGVIIRMMSISKTFESISRTFEMNLSLVRLEDKKTEVSFDPISIV